MGEKNYDMPLDIKIEWCKGCGLCVEFCPRGVLALNIGKVEVQNVDKCIRCGLCQQICPDYVIYVRRGQV
ncbi:hypothetical protein Q428_08355 [Fervidicella metallireducens AeB]|uniref:4Fe-4S ferredoxin-type domain-containing protein n=1 Tax=Fervidicella metallireducens AeB TaxID=1403537 RepID=A0A017RWT6_9CLOT|nr:4Fe-4S binding protein [Fervidicella metallireducens]EYE88400.1 hypothetical protein Q428_08355 [Fervidicella metallireducens AeB]